MGRSAVAKLSHSTFLPFHGIIARSLTSDQPHDMFGTLHCIVCMVAPEARVLLLVNLGNKTTALSYVFTAGSPLNTLTCRGRT
eukprot:3428995-Amphidinium_carterae.1